MNYRHQIRVAIAHKYAVGFPVHWRPKQRDVVPDAVVPRERRSESRLKRHGSTALCRDRPSGSRGQ